MANEIQVEDLPCYECLCLAACKGNSLIFLFRKCEHFYSFIHQQDKDGRTTLYNFLEIKSDFRLVDRLLKLYTTSITKSQS